jgi:phosphoglycerate dehydrogenase-like enzyme
MSRIIVASQLQEAFNTTIAEHAADVEIVQAPPGCPPTLPGGAEVFIAAPFRKAGGALPTRPPKGWPFDLRWIQLVSVGTDFYPNWLFEGPVVTSARGSSAVALAEFCLAAILSATKRMPDIWNHRAADWAPTPLGLVDGTTLGIVGFGAVGEALAPRAQALGMKVIASRRSDAPLGVDGVERVSTDEVFVRADHIVLAAPATPDTAGLVNHRRLALAKRGVHLINIARGALIDDAALLRALDSGVVSLATLDVTHPEPLPEGHRFYGHPQVRLSPHTSVFTPDTRQKLATQFADNLERFRRGDPLLNVVDPQRGY